MNFDLLLKPENLINFKTYTNRKGVMPKTEKDQLYRLSCSKHLLFVINKGEKI